MTSQGPWRIEHIDLNRPLPTIAANPGEGGVYVVFWCNDAPVGTTSLLAAQLPILPEALAAMTPSVIAPAVGSRLYPSAFPGTLNLHRSIPQPVPKGPLDDILSESRVMDRFAWLSTAMQTHPSRETVSVVVCTRKRPVALRRCLDSLGYMTSELVEIIVVDNAPNSPDVAAVTTGRERVRCVAEAHPGLSIARNTGLRNAKGSIIAFTDDDAVAHPQWISRLLAAFADSDVLCVTGLVLPLELRTRSQLAFEFECGGFGRNLRGCRFRDQVFRPMIPFGPPVWHIGAGANMAIRRSALDIVGGFDERLGAGAAGCSEDSEFWYRVLAAGYDCRYEPLAVVFHEHRRTDVELQCQMRAYMKGHVAALLVQYARHAHPGNLRRLFRTLPRHFARQAFEALRPSRWRRWRWLAPELAGYIAGFGALRWFRQIDPASRP